MPSDDDLRALCLRLPPGQDVVFELMNDNALAWRRELAYERLAETSECRALGRIRFDAPKSLHNIEHQNKLAGALY